MECVFNGIKVCKGIHTEEVQSHFSHRAAIRYRYYRCLRTSARFNLTPRGSTSSVGPVTCHVLFTSEHGLFVVAERCDATKSESPERGSDVNVAAFSVERRALTSFLRYGET